MNHHITAQLASIYAEEKHARARAHRERERERERETWGPLGRT